MKKSLMLLLASVMSVSLLTACKDKSSKEITPDAAQQLSGSDATEESDFTSSKALNTLTDAKSLKEQTRSQNKNSFLEIINDTNASQQQRQEAFSNLITLSETIEKEMAVEILLMGKGINDAVVYITNTEANVMINTTELSEAQHAQIEDIAIRHTGMPPDAIVITLLESNTTEESDSTSSVSLDILSDARLLREQTREKIKELLLEIMDNPNISEQQKQEALDSITAISNSIEKETSVETSLVKGGVNDAVVYITNAGIDVVVNAAKLSEAQRAQIEDIIVSNTDIAPETIIICTLFSQ